MSSNATTIVDEDEDYPDWIELFNNSDSQVNMSGYGLSDDPDDIMKWQFGDMYLGPGQFLLIFASGKDRPDTMNTGNSTSTAGYRNGSANYLHTNFKIKSEGEWLLLSDPQGILIDSVYTGQIPTDISRGRKPDGGGDWLYFSEATPGSPNTTTGSEVPVEIHDVYMSPPAGFYTANMTVAMTTSGENQSIFYTTDGSLPDSLSLPYQEPILLDQTTIVRAVSANADGESGRVLTQTYFIDEKRPLPVFSIAVNPKDFDLIYDDFDAEVPVHIELFEKSGVQAFSSNAGVEVFGQGSAEFEQKSLAIFFRNIYGNGTLNYKLFPELPFVQYESFLLRNSGNDWWSTLFRDALVTNGLMKGTEVDYQAYEPSVVFINGVYWGIHNIREKVNEHYIEAHHYIRPENLDMLEYKEVVIPEVNHGDRNHYNEMITFLELNDLSDPENYEYLSSIIDIDNFMDYQIAEIFCANIDWPANNNRFFRSRSPDGKWRWILYDTDTGFGLWDDWWADGTPGWELNHFEHALNAESSGSTEGGWPNPGWSTFIFRKLMGNRAFRNRFINRFADYLNTRFSPSHITETINAYQGGIAEAVPDHLERWGRSIDDYEREVRKVRSFGAKRQEFVRSHIAVYFNLEGTSRLEPRIEPLHGGGVKLNSLYITGNQWEGIYFKGVPVTLVADPAPGYRFSHWSEKSDSNRILIMNPEEDMTVTAFFEPAPGTGSVVINEINYNSHDDFDPGDWVELYNNSSGEVDLTGWKLCDESESNVFDLPEGNVIERGEYLVLCRDEQDFSLLYPSITNFTGDLGFGLSSAGDAVRLYDASDNLVDSVAFLPGPPWPGEANGFGSTLELIHPELDNANAENWAVSHILGTPGKRNSVFQLPYQEMPVEKDEDQPSWIRVYPNPSADQVNFRLFLLRESLVVLTVYDILGRKTASVINKRFFGKGESVIHWDARNANGNSVSAGIYFYMLKVNHKIVDSGKFVKL